MYILRLLQNTPKLGLLKHTQIPRQQVPMGMEIFKHEVAHGRFDIVDPMAAR